MAFQKHGEFAETDGSERSALDEFHGRWKGGLERFFDLIGVALVAHEFAKLEL